MATVMMRDRRHGPLMVMVAGDAGGEERHGPLMELQLGKVGAGSSTNG